MALSPLARHSVPVAALSLLLLGAPASAAPAAGLTCTTALAASASAGLMASGEAVEAEVTIAATHAACTDTRADVEDGKKIIGAEVTAPEAGSINGTCKEFEASAGLELTWLLADGGKGEATEVALTAAVKGGEVKKKHSVTGGDLDGWELAITPVNAEELKRHLAAACATEEGVQALVAQLSLTFSEKA